VTVLHKIVIFDRTAPLPFDTLSSVLTEPRDIRIILIPPELFALGLCSVLRPRQHSIGYMGDGFYRSKDPTNSIKVLKEMLQRNKKPSCR